MRGYFCSLTCAVCWICKAKMLLSTVVLLHFEPHCGLGLTVKLSGENRDFARIWHQERVFCKDEEDSV